VFECGGGNASCAYAILAAVALDTTTVVHYESNYPIGGFQFTIQNFELNSVDGGQSEVAGFEVEVNDFMVLAYSQTGSTIPAGSGTLIILEGYPLEMGPVVLSNIVISNPNGEAMATCYDDGNGCTPQDYVPNCGCLDPSGCNFDPNANLQCPDYSCTYAETNYDCDGNCVIDVDDCGECGGDGSTCAPPELFQFNQSTLQAFYYFSSVTIDEIPVDSEDWVGTFNGDVCVGGDDLFMSTNTSGYMLVADGTNYNPVAMSGDIAIDSAGATTIQATSVDNSMLAGSIANAKLSNSSVSYGGVSVSLGSSDTTPAFCLCDATAYKGDSALVSRCIAQTKCWRGVTTT
jgi:hypothetical protein